MNREQIITQFFENMRHVGKHFGKHMASDKTPKGTPTRAQFGLLFGLEHDGQKTIKDLAEYFGMSPSAITQLVEPMVKEGYVTRHDDAKDRRKIHIQLTAKGKKMLLAAKKQRFATMKKIFEALSDSELENMKRYQDKIIKYLTDHERT